MTKQILINGLNRNQREGYKKRSANMMEKSVSTRFQAELRKALPGCEVIKHADKSMIGMVDASITYNKKTLWVEYKFIRPATAGVEGKAFIHHGTWHPRDVAMASPTQYATACRLAVAGHCCYLFWVLDHEAIRQRIKHIMLWHPLDNEAVMFADTKDLVEGVVKALVTKDLGYLSFDE